MKYLVEVWQYGKQSMVCYCNKKDDVSEFISFVIHDYDKGECALHIYKSVFGKYRLASFDEKMKFLDGARK